MECITNIVVRYAETDRMGIVHHSVYPIWFEVARTNYIKMIDVSYSAIEELGIMMPLTDLECKFHATCTYEDEVKIFVTTTRLTPARMEFYYKVFLKGKMITEGITKHAWVDAKTFRPINAKKRIPLIYKRMQEAMTNPKTKEF